MAGILQQPLAVEESEALAQLSASGRCTGQQSGGGHMTLAQPPPHRKTQTWPGQCAVPSSSALTAWKSAVAPMCSCHMAIATSTCMIWWLFKK